jgi:O-antigen/teichoic acid export membrane protein
VALAAVSGFILSVSWPVERGFPSRRGTLRSGVMTGFAQVALSAAAAAAGALLAHKFGRTARTDGFLAAYQVYTVVTLAAQSFRLIVVPDLTRAAERGALAAELGSYVAGVGAVALPATTLVALLAGPVGDALAGTVSATAAHEAASAVVWLVPAAFIQLVGALCASALAALDSYGTAAVGSAAGGVAGVALFAALADRHGLVSLAWGLTLDACIATAVPLARLLQMRRLKWGRREVAQPLSSLWRLIQGSALPIAMQAFTLVALHVLGRLGVGKDTSFSYANLLGLSIIAATGYSLGVVALAPLTRRGLDTERAAAYVVHASWLTLALAGAATGVIALVGAPIFAFVLGDQYRHIGDVFLQLTPWVVASTLYYTVFPLLFVAERRGRLVAVAAAALALDVPVAVVFRNAWGMPGVSVSLALMTLAVAIALMLELSPRLLALVVPRMARLVVVVAILTAACFGLPPLVLHPLGAAVVGLAAYTTALLALRRHGLQDAWTYVRALG